ncbi:MAG: LysM peptidoglycan-binding domain-containing protein [Peptococcaceae bacterium]|nr:MAG: LysM peptidoglycan-binding domain-containing protein [Peptococcaceae bacterium]
MLPSAIWAATPAENQQFSLISSVLQKAGQFWEQPAAPAKAPQTPENVAGADTSTYTVQPGDTLFQIGLKFNVGYQEIMSANGLGSADIYPGMTLLIPSTTPEQPLSSSQVSRSGSFERPSPDEVDLLARLITAEADGESYLAKVAVGAVVLNRVKSSDFPNTIQEVIFEPYQFEPVQNGFIYRPASAESLQAAKDALNGQDPTGGALYFFESWVPNRFLQSRPVSMVIGALTFAY